ncbi:hypothetical protein [Brunnivagina elsteri]|uniref:Outer membrane protein beta-barrel domain-containing protein n=1 Tax=Brunnivagina elsteri CCALA 953 TaxID=987040 RepID=A0A2A2TCM6_9CYAN|nr:hypothetical protein [Calothrix elsteri]PAX51396.1 hypothetical protein CK510_25025 [Calothrix elsteri CCALA 953]
MNNIFSQNQILCLLTLASVVLLGSNSSAVAQTANVIGNNQAASRASNNVVPIPGTVATTSAAFANSTATITTPNTGNQTASNQSPSKQIAQADINPGRVTRGGSSYVGVAGNIGIGGGDSALGDGNFAVISKIGLTRTISVRPSAVFSDNTAILIPVTYDFSAQSSEDPFAEPLPFAPYVGVGAAIKTGNDESRIGFLVSGGVDIPLNQQFTATAAVNAAFFDQTDVGLLLGIGYNFRGL